MKLQIEQVSKTYKGEQALSNFTVELTEGVHALLGPNGAGKSTLLKIIAGVLNPSSGHVFVDGEDTIRMGERYRELLGYLPQHFGLYKNFTAERFLLYIAALKGLDKRTASQKVTEVLQEVNLEDVRHTQLRKFSGGMKQRMGIAQALLNDPKILIVDEPTAGLDPKERIRFRNVLASLAGNRIVLFSTHIISDVEYVAQDILLVKDGHLVGYGAPESLLSQMQGHVWQVSCSQNEVAKYQGSFQIANMCRIKDRIELRIIAGDKPVPHAVAVNPTLEDLYLFQFGEEAVSDGTSVNHAI
ncbi:ABC transporter ATP-binding protein [Alicyclobacillus tolerans]|uniref:ABC-type multidrug transport system, ATPase component n=1 Tax=Alicyclobacillus tolerans TaxID=90970 RepID=A0A1M6UKV8_9BACL|nr:ABC transporter ATP-binding protein [Alicyclobacillus montanus]SHK69773.1 ABC-type multidrug transport system, ATPase component [Alicyclobacillus montanus]